MELVKIEAFDHWIDDKLGDKKRKKANYNQYIIKKSDRKVRAHL